MIQVDETFKGVDKDGSGALDRNEIKQVLNELRKGVGDGQPADVTEVTEEMVTTIMKEIATKVKDWDDKSPGTVSLLEFREWYTDSSERKYTNTPHCDLICMNLRLRDGLASGIREQVIEKFNDIDIDKSGTLDKSEITLLLQSGKGKVPTEAEIGSLWAEMLAIDNTDGETDGVISLREFLDWYNNSEFMTSWVELQSNEVDNPPFSISPPTSSPLGMAIWVIMLPINGAVSQNHELCIQTRSLVF